MEMAGIINSGKMLFSAIFLILALVTPNLCCVYCGFPHVLECEFYDPEVCDVDVPDERCHLGTNCDPTPGRPAHCMVQWQNNSGSIEIMKKGCWGEDKRCVGKSGCFEDRFTPDEYFCCCEGHRCNANFSYTPQRQSTEADDYFREFTVCEYYDNVKCGMTPEVCNQTSITCEKPKYGKQVHCYAIWANISGEYQILKKGCWLDQFNCRKSTCVNTAPSTSIYRSPDFCCCSGSMCNVDVLHRYFPSSENDDGTVEAVPEPAQPNQLVMTLVYSLLPICFIAVLILLIFYMWRNKRSAYHEPLPTIDVSPIPPPTPPMTDLKPIQLLEIKARGRFGCVWKAQMLSEVVAVKIFPLQDRQSYLTETEIYQLPYFGTHANILRFITGEKHVEHRNTELWLITEFHEKGSLYDFLKGNLVSWPDVIKIAETMACGLAFLHEEITSHQMCQYKPAVVHRDFKSKNVLIKHDNTACIADFGLALKFDMGRPIGDTHGQVGTRRYMAPEVLEGAINFSRHHFMNIDMYACGLVLWEIISRCSAADGPVEEYQLPFEDEVGQHPTLEDMQDVVVQRKHRPPYREQWSSHAGLMSMYRTITECWDTDPEARLSAGCVQERIAQLAATTLHNTSNQLPPVLMTTNTETPPKDTSLTV